MAQLDINVKATGIEKTTADIKKLDTSLTHAKDEADKFYRSVTALAKASLTIYSLKQLSDVTIATGKAFLNTAAQFEKFNSVLKTLEGSSQKAQKSFNWIQDFAKTTPFNIDKVTESFIKLRAYGLDPTQGLLRTLGDASSAMGKDIIQAVEAIADAVTGENERLKEFGIKASVEGQKIKYNWTASSGEMRNIVIDNNSAIIQSTLEAIFNSKYKGAMDEQSKTWAGMVSNMEDNWTNFANLVMQESGVFDSLKGSLEDLNKALVGLNDKDTVAQLVKDTKDLAETIALVGGSYVAVNTAIKTYTIAVGTAHTITTIFQGGVWGLNTALVATAVSAKALDKVLKFSAFSAVVGGIALLTESFIENKKRADNLNKSVKELADSFELLDLKARLVDVNSELKEMDDRFKTYSDAQKLMYKGAYDLAYKEKQQLEGSIKLIEEKGKQTSKIVDLFKSIDETQIGNKGQGDPLGGSSATDKAKKELEKRRDQYINYYEAIKDYANQWKYEEQKIREDNIYLTKQELDKLIVAKKQAFDIENQLQKDMITTDEWKAYYRQIGDYESEWLLNQGELFAKWETVLGDKFPQMLEIAKTEYFDKMKEEMDKLKAEPFDFKISFDGMDNSISKVIQSMEHLSEAQEKYNEYVKENAKDEKAIADAKEKHNKNLIIGYSNIAGAIGGMFESGSREAASFQAAQNALALVEGTRAILTAGTGDPYTAIPRMVAMGAMVSSLLSNIGVAFGMNRVSTVSDAFSAQTANTGTGTTLGDATAQSKSITDSLSILEDFAQPQYDVLNSMNKYLESIANNLGGVTSLLIRNAGFALGEGYEGFDTGFKNTYSLNSSMQNLLSPSTGLMSKIPILKDISGLFGNVVNSVLGGLFGKTSVSQTLTDSGIFFADTLLSSAIKELEGQAFQTITTTVTKKSLFSKSTSTTVNSYFQALDDETERQFSLVLRNLYNTVLTAGEALDSASVDTEKALENFIVSIGKISLKGKTGDQIQETLESVFGSIGDKITESAFPLLIPFQQVGEGLFETLTRVATGMEEANYYGDRLNLTIAKYSDIVNKQGVVGFEALLQSILSFEYALNPVNNNLALIVENLNGTAEELYNVYSNLDELRGQLFFLGQDTNGLSASMINGAGSIGELQKGFNDYFENFLSNNDQLLYSTRELSFEFAKLGLDLPTTKEAFSELLDSIDLTSESGQKLYGQLISLSGAFSDVAEESGGFVSVLSANLKTIFNDLSNSLYDVFNTFVDLGRRTASTLSGLKGNNTTELNKLIAQFEAVRGGTNTTAINDTYSQLLTMAGSLGGDIRYSGAIERLLSGYQGQFKSAEDIIRVNIVEGLGELLNLNEEQLIQLQTSVNDGKLTNDELNSINGLTKTQKDGILEFANNSEYFSTESTLLNLEEYSKLQLESLRKANESQTESLSAKTLSYGDTIGTQEQIDLAKLFGASYESISPFIKQIQDLSNSTNVQADVESLIGYSSGTYNKSSFSMLSSLSPYLSEDINSAISTVSSKIEFYDRYNEAQKEIDIKRKKLEDEYDIIYPWLTGTKSGAYPNSPIEERDSTLNGAQAFSIINSMGYPTQGSNEYGKYYLPKSALAYKILDDMKNNISALINPLEKEKTAKGYYTGGYTGNGGKYDVAGVVHRGEYVVNQEQLRNIGGVSGLESALRGGNDNLVKILSSELSQLRSDFATLLKQFKSVTNNGDQMRVKLIS